MSLGLNRVVYFERVADSVRAISRGAFFHGKCLPLAQCPLNFTQTNDAFFSAWSTRASVGTPSLCLREELLAEKTSFALLAAKGPRYCQ